MTDLVHNPNTQVVAYSDADYAITPETAERLRTSIPTNTTAAYNWAWGRFTEWCAETQRVPLPATPQTLADYTTTLITADLAPATVDHAIGAIRSRHRRAGHRGHPDTTAALDLLRAYRRQWADAGGRVRKAPPLLLAGLRAMVDTCDDSPAGIRDRALLLVGFNMMARRSELSGLDVGDLAIGQDGLTVFVRRSKTDQSAIGVEVAIPYGQHPHTCAIRSAAAWFGLLAERRLTAGAAFRPVDRHGKVGGQADASGKSASRLSGKSVSAVVRRRAELAELPHAEKYTGHSLRSGAATVAYAAGAPVSSIARHGRWSPTSPIVLGYIRGVDKWRDNPMLGAGL